MHYLSLLKPTVESFGFALCLTISATSIWGGIFPYLQDVLRTNETTALFYTVQLLAMCGTFAALFAFTRQAAITMQQRLAILWAVPAMLGPSMLIASMYVNSLAPALIIGAAIFLGSSQAGFLAGWEMTFASREGKEGNLCIVVGTACSAIVYFVLCLIPPAVCAYMIPLILVPLEGLCLWLSIGKSSNDQPMFEDVPAQHGRVYQNALQESIAPALMVGALGFSAGAIRFIAITRQNLNSEINLFSMFAMLIVVLVFLGFWHIRNIRIELPDVYRVLFPIAATCLLALPFVGHLFTDFAEALCYACFVLATTLVLMHCCQVSRDSGTNPAFIFCFYYFIIYVSQLLGYAIGYASGANTGMTLNVEQLSLVSITALYLLLVVSLVGRKQSRLHTSRLDFLMLSPDKESQPSAEIAIAKQIESQGTKDDEEYDAGQFTDRISKQCRTLSDAYGLSKREAEVMELIARGWTGASISEKLFISENTTRTHTRRIYAKLGVHKKQELIALVGSAMPQ